MGKKYKKLIGLIADKDNIMLAARKARKGNPSSVAGMVFMDHLEANALLLSKLILNGSYRPGPPREFVIHEPKRRQISALPFVDRVVQHAINNVIEPIFTRTFYSQSYGCIKGKGTHSGAIKCQSIMRKLSRRGPVFILKTDFAGYFYNIDRVVLHKLIKSKISCERTIGLIECFVPNSGVKIAIGDLLSQLFANVYGTMADQWLLHHAKRKNFIRYMDDIVIFGSDRSEMLELKSEFEKFCKEEMKLSLSKWSVTSLSQGVNFLGYRIWTTHKLMRKQSVRSAKRKIKKYIKHNEKDKLMMFIASWMGHAKWADSRNLINHLKFEMRKVERCL